MSESKKHRVLAVPMTISVYPHERDALIRLMNDNRFKSTFDVVRKLAQDLKVRDFEPPKKRSC